MYLISVANSQCGNCARFSVKLILPMAIVTVLSRGSFWLKVDFIEYLDFHIVKLDFRPSKLAILNLSVFVRISVLLKNLSKKKLSELIPKLQIQIVWNSVEAGKLNNEPTTRQIGSSQNPAKIFK